MWYISHSFTNTDTCSSTWLYSFILILSHPDVCCVMLRMHICSCWHCNTTQHAFLSTLQCVQRVALDSHSPGWWFAAPMRSVASRNGVASSCMAWIVMKATRLISFVGFIGKMRHWAIKFLFCFHPSIKQPANSKTILSLLMRWCYFLLSGKCLWEFVNARSCKYSSNDKLPGIEWNG